MNPDKLIEMLEFADINARASDVIEYTKKNPRTFLFMGYT